MTVHETQIFPEGSKLYIWHMHGNASSEAVFKQSFPEGTTITSIKIRHKTSKIERWTIFGTYEVQLEDLVGDLRVRILINGKEVLLKGPWEWSVGETLEATLSESDVHLDGQQNEITVEYSKATYGNSNAYQMWFSTYMEVDADNPPTETVVNVISTTSREEALHAESSYEMLGQMMQFMVLFMFMSMMMSAVSAMGG